jgi:hypothetical protein
MFSSAAKQLPSPLVEGVAKVVGCGLPHHYRVDKKQQTSFICPISQDQNNLILLLRPPLFGEGLEETDRINSIKFNVIKVMDHYPSPQPLSRKRVL